MWNEGVLGTDLFDTTQFHTYTTGVMSKLFEHWSIVI